MEYRFVADRCQKGGERGKAGAVILILQSLQHHVTSIGVCAQLHIRERSHEPLLGPIGASSPTYVQNRAGQTHQTCRGGLQSDWEVVAQVFCLYLGIERQPSIDSTVKVRQVRRHTTQCSGARLFHLTVVATAELCRLVLDSCQRAYKSMWLQYAGSFVPLLNSHGAPASMYIHHTSFAASASQIEHRSNGKLGSSSQLRTLCFISDK